MSRVYAVRLDNVSVSTAKTLIQITAPSSATLVVHRLWVSQTSTTTSNMQQVSVVRKSAGGTGTSFTPVPLASGSPAAGTACIVDLTGEGTDSATIIRDAFNLLNGWLWLPVPEEKLYVPPSGILGLKLPVAPASATSFVAGIIFEETG